MEAVDTPNITWRLDKAIAHQRIGDILLEQGHPDDALAEFREFRAGVREALDRDSEQGDWLRYLANSYVEFGDVYMAKQVYVDAMKEYQEALRIYKGLIAKDATRASWLRNLAITHQRLGRAYQAKGDKTQSITEYEECLRVQTNDNANDFQLITPRRVHAECQRLATQIRADPQ